ncbi:Gfo/Idh/MocA family protein [Fictibacillus gelatini]|uniref:Gfo/Idh/MocA family protein n=1 Tax=Fictibacillus gelatini TaxID=225985 RepID=UPI000429CBFD|nr:Gfo/Idh/MocA family oxidoreductase [Fictibacillus gelatini]
MVNFAIVGCGHIAKKHARAIERCKGARLVAVCDTIPENMDVYQQTYDATPYTKTEELLDDPRIDAVSICTPSGLHAKLAMLAAGRKKHVIVEKPMALCLKDAEDMIAAAKLNQVKLAVVHPNRFRPAISELKRVVEEGWLGKISHINATVRWNRNQAYYDQATWRGTRSLDGGVLMNQAIHNLDLMLWLAGNAVEVFSMCDTRIREIEAEDVAVGVVKFESGALGVIEAATTIYPENYEESISLFGEYGSIKIGGKSATKIEHWSVKNIDEKTITERIEHFPQQKSGHEVIIEDMMKAIKDDRPPVVSGEDGLSALRFVLALYESAAIKQPVNVRNFS